ncbi:TetR family transcriptional regulator [Streptomyces sp. DSM 44917]|uniref:TetR family transcriptional regulator n=1 Tax=Streptomyces boetiae TaxID=3075541 RepID=A0ABU2LBL0_9ACTN|nr:TetR family transcriptional regulator [Streptomyces sp. DSM 44917]MDT0308692.1 TetR family transcriptional regulator [Streptomyces sp. DSM 44917]
MGRRPKFAEDDFLDAALGIAVARGAPAVTIADVAAAAGAPVGSVYHRFASRDLLLARLWVRSVRRVQRAFLDAPPGGDDPGLAAERAVALALRWVAEHPGEARLLLLHRREDLVRRWPRELGEELAGLNDAVADALRGHARALYGRASKEAVERVTFALVDIPYAAVRRRLASGEPLPPTLERMAVAACRAALAD